MGFWSQWAFTIVQAGGAQGGQRVLMPKVLPAYGRGLAISVCVCVCVCVCVSLYVCGPLLHEEPTWGGKGKVITDDIGPKGGN